MIETKGNLFNSSDNLCHCVSADMHMGKGIAVEFKKKWGVPRAPVKSGFCVGDIAIIKEEGSQDERSIIYLVTKDRYWQKPTYESLRTCLIKVRELGMSSLSIPRIGCGLDGLSWDKVKAMIDEELPDISITVYSL